jgi:hypothetical protein
MWSKLYILALYYLFNFASVWRVRINNKYPAPADNRHGSVMQNAYHLIRCFYRELFSEQVMLHFTLFCCYWQIFSASMNTKANQFFISLFLTFAINIRQSTDPQSLGFFSMCQGIIRSVQSSRTLRWSISLFNPDPSVQFAPRVFSLGARRPFSESHVEPLLRVHECIFRTI